MVRVSASLTGAQARYKAVPTINFARLRRSKQMIFLDISEASNSKDNLAHKLSGPFRALYVANRTVSMQRGCFVDRVSAGRVTLAPVP